MCKRKLGEKLFNIKRQLHLAMRDGTSTEMAVLHLMDDFDFDLEEVKASWWVWTSLLACFRMDANTFSEKGLNVSFSNVKFIDIAPFVNLDYIRNLGDALLFDLRRSRTPTELFKDIVSDMDVLLIWYGTLQSHTTQARSRFLAPVSILPITAWITDFFNIHQIFNRLVAQFDSSFRNMTPESFMNGRIRTRGKIHYSVPYRCWCSWRWNWKFLEASKSVWMPFPK